MAGMHGAFKLGRTCIMAAMHGAYKMGQDMHDGRNAWGIQDGAGHA
jgi:hypothetical protein